MSIDGIHDDLISRFIRCPGALAMRLRIARPRLLGVCVGDRCWIRRIWEPRNPWDISIGNEAGLDNQVVLLTTGARKKAPRFLIGGSAYVNASR
jgi:hypothetical protein